MVKIAIGLIGLLLSFHAVAADVTVFAAASLKESLDAVAKSFTAATGNKVVVSYGASSALAQQIEHGAPADVFISADLDWMDYVEKHNLIAPGSRINLLRNELVLIAPANSRVNIDLKPGLDLAAALGRGRLAIAMPDVVPAGKYGKAALTALGAWTGVEHHLAPAENVRGALFLVSRGECPLGIVYKTDALADPGVRIAGIFPAAAYPAVIYPGALTASGKSPAARAFLDFLSQSAAKEIWTRFGFRLAE